MLELVGAEYVEGHTIRICFNSGECGIVDLKDALWGLVFEAMKDLDVFKRFRVSDVLHTVCWENNADLSPEFLCDKMVKQVVARGPAGARS
jgi:hypothetical protein